MSVERGGEVRMGEERRGDVKVGWCGEGKMMEGGWDGNRSEG